MEARMPAISNLGNSHFAIGKEGFQNVKDQNKNTGPFPQHKGSVGGTQIAGSFFSQIHMFLFGNPCCRLNTADEISQSQTQNSSHIVTSFPAFGVVYQIDTHFAINTKKVYIFCSFVFRQKNGRGNAPPCNPYS